MSRTMYYNGVVYNVGDKTTDGFIVSGDNYSFVGTNKELLSKRKKEDILVDLRGKQTFKGSEQAAGNWR